jgi:hypothetical protein
VLPSEHMATTTSIPGAGLRRRELLVEIQTRLELTEGHVAQLRTSWRALPSDHPRRDELLRRIEVDAAVAAELLDLLSLITGKDADYALPQE